MCYTYMYTMKQRVTMMVRNKQLTEQINGVAQELLGSQPWGVSIK